MSRLLCRQNDVAVVWQNVNGIRIHMVNGCQHILSAWVHGLTALNQIINANALEDLAKALSNGYGNETIRLSRFLCFRFLSLFLCLLRFRYLLRFFDQFLLMFFSHVVDLDPGKRTVSQRFLDRKSRIIRMDMDLDHIIIRNHNHAVTDGG